MPKPNPIEGLKPEIVWKYFAQIAKIPRCSKNEAAICQYVQQTAKKLGLEAKADPVGNVVIRKPAPPGCENARSICLQGHLDMVCEKNKDKTHDFAKDPIEIVRKDNVLCANGTTLGADNGIGVAAGLAVLEDKTLRHGPIEVLLTVDEETGLTGANSLLTGFVESHTLINLDSEEEGSLFVGCSGGRDTRARWQVELEPAPAGHVLAQVLVRGLRGGHSGLEIDKGRGNALKIITRVLMQLSGSGCRIASLNGGNKHNAIPRESDAVLLVPEKNLPGVEDTVSRMESLLKAEISSVDPDLSVSFERIKGARKPQVWRRSQQKKILQTLSAVPHGVIKMSSDLPGLVETSTNLAVVSTRRGEISVVTSQRSSVASEIDDIAQTVRSVFELGGAEVASGHGYPGWKPNMDSAVLKTARETYLQMFGKEPEVKAIHAGLECGIIGEKYPGMDMVSFGPTLEAVHSPDEKIYIDTVERFWNYLTALLAAHG